MKQYELAGSPVKPYAITYNIIHNIATTVHKAGANIRDVDEF